MEEYYRLLGATQSDSMKELKKVFKFDEENASR